MSWSVSPVSKIYNWLQDLIRNEKIFNARLDEELAGIAGAINAITTSSGSIDPKAIYTDNTRVTSAKIEFKGSTSNLADVGIRVADGTQLAPTINFINDPDSGIRGISDGKWALVRNGADYLTLDTGLITATQTISAPQITLPITAPANNTDAANKKYVDDTVATASGNAILRDGSSTTTHKIPFAGGTAPDGGISINNGTVGTPAVNFISNTNYGIYLRTASAPFGVGLVAAGTQIIDASTAGLAVNSGDFAVNPGSPSKFKVTGTSGDTTITGSFSINPTGASNTFNVSTAGTISANGALGLGGNITVGSSTFVVTATSGNTVITGKVGSSTTIDAPLKLAADPTGVVTDGSANFNAATKKYVDDKVAAGAAVDPKAIYLDNTVSHQSTAKISFPGTGPTNVGIEVPNGTAALPAINFIGETGSGMFRTGTNDWGLTVGGTQRLQLTSTGISIIGTLGVSSNTTLKGQLVCGGCWDEVTDRHAEPYGTKDDISWRASSRDLRLELRLPDEGDDGTGR